MFLPLKTYAQARADFRRAYLETVLRATHGNVAAAAASIGYNRTVFYRLVARAGIKPADFRPPVVPSASALAQRAKRARRWAAGRPAWVHPVGAALVRR